MNERVIRGTIPRRGKGTPLSSSDTIVRLSSCPDCEGRGYFILNPFATGGYNGMGGPGNIGIGRKYVRLMARNGKIIRVQPHLIQRVW